MTIRHISLIALTFGLLPATAWAADDADRADIVVTARLAQTARDQQQHALNIVNAQSAETIAKYPDVNAAEALSRLPGVSLSIDTAEGRFVNIRGLDGNLDGATMGGVVLLNTQPGGTYFNAAGRAVEFDTVPIGAVDRIVVTKTGMPDHDAEGIGGTVELTPRTAIGLHHLFVEATLGGGIETFKGKGLYREELVVGGPLLGGKDEDPVLSFVASQFLYNDHRTFDDLEAAYADSPPTPDKAYAALELRKYGYNRKRFGYSGEVDYTSAPDQRFYVRASLAGYNEHVYRNRLEIDFNGATTVDPANGNGLLADTVNPVKTLRDENEAHRNLLVQIGGDNHFGAAHVEYWAAYSRATYDKYYDYNSTFENGTNYNLTYNNITDPNYPRYSVVTGTGFLDPANYALTKINNGTEHDRDREWSYAASVALPLGLAADDEIKVGGKLRFRHKTAMPFTATAKFDGSQLLSQYAIGGDYTNFYHAGYNNGPGINGDPLRGVFDGSGTALPLNTGGYFDDNEDISAAFAQYQGTFGALGVLAGVRFEHTHAVYRGIGSITDIDGNSTDLPLSTTRSYDNVFPTLQLRYQAMPSLVARATYSTGLARPGFYQTQQSTSIDVGGLTVSTGNPLLRPTYSHNFDVSLEYYLPDAGIISIGAFDKEMLNYIVTRSQIVSGYAGNSGIFNISTYENARHAHARGVEASFVDRFRGLPGLLSGFGIDANATYVSTGVALRAGEGNVALPGSFPWSWNAALFYETGPVLLRLSSQFESHVLFGVGGTRASDIFQDSRTTLDFNGSYTISRNLQVYLNAKNLTNAPLRFYEGTPNRPIQREFYDVTLETGVKLKF